MSERKLYVMRGLPGAGKTRRARQICKHTGALRVNKDDLRQMLMGEEYCPDLEHVVHDAHEEMVAEILADRSRDLVIDNTNLRARDVRRYAELAESWNYRLEIVDIETSAEDCIIRDIGRAKEGGRYVGEEVIRDMARRFGRG